MRATGVGGQDARSLARDLHAVTMSDRSRTSSNIPGRGPRSVRLRFEDRRRARPSLRLAQGMVSCAEHVQQLGGVSPLHIKMGRSDSEAQGRHREVGSEGSVEQKREPMDKNRIRGLGRRTSVLPIAKSTTIKSARGRSGGCAWKAVRLITGDLQCVLGIED